MTIEEQIRALSYAIEHLVAQIPQYIKFPPEYEALRLQLSETKESDNVNRADSPADS